MSSRLTGLVDAGIGLLAHMRSRGLDLELGSPALWRFEQALEAASPGILRQLEVIRGRSSPSVRLSKSTSPHRSSNALIQVLGERRVVPKVYPIERKPVRARKTNGVVQVGASHA